MKHLINLCIVINLCWGVQAIAVDYYVNPNGNDSWSGSIKTPSPQLDDGPFKTLERAKQAIRSLKQSHAFNDKVTVNIAGGIYYLTRPLSFNLMDSGFAGREIVWQGEPDAEVIISGGLPITCEKRDALIWDCPLAQLPENKDFFDTGRIKGNAPKFELYVNHQKLELARWPDQDWAHIKIPLDQKTQFSVMETMPVLSGEISAAQVHIFPGNDWFDQIIGIEAVNQTDNTIKTATPTAYPLDSGRRFYIQNLPSLLNAPGEWFYDRGTKTISFVPPEGMKPQAMTVSSLPNILMADGLGYVTFKNIGFQYSANTAIAFNNVNNILLDQLQVSNVGGKGVEIKNSQNIHLTNSKIHHTGAQGVIVSGGDRSHLQSSGHVIYNNHIHHMGTTLLTYSPGIDVSGVGTKIAHNLLEQGAGTAILFSGNDHLIEKNEVHHFCLQASDCGAIYTGRDWSARGNVIRNNYIHDITGFGMKSVDVATNQVVYQSPNYAMGVYLDDGASGFDISANIFENATISLHLHGGRDNKIYNNYFKTDDFAIWSSPIPPAFLEPNQKTLDASPYKTAIWQQKYPELATPMHNKAWPEGNRIERNIFVTSKPGGNSFRYFLPRDSTVIANNIIWSTTGKLAVDYNVLELNHKVGGAPWAEWVAQGIDKNSIIADPCVTIVNKKMITCAGSPIKDIGFQPLPSDIGLIQ